MKFLWYSVAPWAATGYGMVTRELVPRLISEGHDVIIATKHAHVGTVEWEGIQVISGIDISMMNRMVEKGEVDYIISLIDNHILPTNLDNWISYCPFDTETLPDSIKRYLKYVKLLIALTRHGQDEFKKNGFDSFYAPHGVDPDIYKIDDRYRNENRKRLEWEDNFIIGTVGVNYPDDRKNFVRLMRAFKTFHERHPLARLYMATNHIDEKTAYPIPLIAEDLGIVDYMALTSDDDYIRGIVTDTMMANRYRLMDVMCLPTKGEGFGLPLIEAQACGTPIITTNASTGPELLKGGWLIDVGEHDWEYFNKSWRANVTVESILIVLEKAYKSWEDGSIREVGRIASESIHNSYDWDYIFDTCWRPILKEIEGLKTKVKDYPDYPVFNGRITMADCGEWCTRKCTDFPLLPNETKETSILIKSYPIRPNNKGELYVDTNCPLHKWLAKRFIIDVKRVWAELWGYPRIRELFKEIPSSYIPLDSVKVAFNDEYKWAMQSKYHTVCPELDLQGKVLDVGCGDGERVRKLQEKGIDAIGVEVNDSCLKEGIVIKGSAEKLDFPDNTFDVVLSVDVLEHLEDPIKGLSEMFRVSKDRVIAFVTTTESPEFWQDPTHKAEWSFERWKREINEFGKIVNIINPCGFEVKKYADK